MLATVVQLPVSLRNTGIMAGNSIKKSYKSRRKTKEQESTESSEDDSLSSETERKTTPRIRASPKLKRKRESRKYVPDKTKRRKTSSSSTVSERESVSNRNTSTKTVAASSPSRKKEGHDKKKRRQSKCEDENYQKQKANISEELLVTPQCNVTHKFAEGKLKASVDSFIQNGPCYKVASKLPSCLECSKPSAEGFCRFYGFRRLRYTNNGDLVIAGFSIPCRDSLPEDLKLWLPGVPPSDLDVEMSLFLLRELGDQFCDMLQQEKEVVSLHIAQGKTVAWKRVVQGVREMCDICETTIFNYHWGCGKCGLFICIDCYKAQKNRPGKAWRVTPRVKSLISGLPCKAHEQEKLLLTQIIAADAMSLIEKRMHEARKNWGIPEHCSCIDNSKTDFKKKEVNIKKEKTEDLDNCPLSWFAGVALSQDKKPGLDKIKNTVKEEKISGELKHFIRRFKHVPPRGTLPARKMTLTESRSQYPGVPHSWLCDGQLLRLHSSKNDNNYDIFQDQWKRGQPVLISDITKELRGELWTPESFLRDFGHTKNDFVDCATGTVFRAQSMRVFWEGFISVRHRMKNEKGQARILKLRDWPPAADFSEMLPSRYKDLMKALPLGEYTRRDGRLNLTSRLPISYVRPDLGPKMYTAYGGPSAGTTNIHLDMSDAVNVMVYVGIPSDMDSSTYNKEALKAIANAGCDLLTKRRLREKDQLPGALWHIYMASDADKIRDLLNKVSLERGNQRKSFHDPIHDQSWYLDSELRKRLHLEYNVVGYTIVQCLGDAIFIPAGAPHQVQNLHNCIKVAEDFVSPENVSHCFHLTQEFRMLSNSHSNHEDKLQIKNIIYHAVKDSLAVLSKAELNLKSEAREQELGSKPKIKSEPV